MAIQINEISEKYINKLGKSYFNTVKHSDAISAIKNAVKETSEALKEEIKQAIEPLKSKIAEKDEFITSQAKENEKLTKENQELKSKINSYNPIIQEAYKQGITQEIREKKSVLVSVISGLIRNNEELNKTKSVQLQKVKTEEVPVVKKQNGTEKAHKVQNRTVAINPEIIKKIETQRKNQKLDKERLDKAGLIIKTLLEDAPQDSFAYRGVQKQFKKTMDYYIRTANNHINNRYFERDNYGKIRIGTDSNGRIILKERGFELKDKSFTPYKFKIFNADGSQVEIYDGNSDSYIEFRDTNGQKLLKICYGEHYGIFIHDKNGKLMVAEGIKDGVVKYLNINFNEVKPIAEIENDEVINAYARRLMLGAKHDCKISTVDFGIQGKIVDDGYGKPKIIQYGVKGITSIEKRRPDGERKDFSMRFYKNTENEHWEIQSLYDENYIGDKDSFLQREIYEKRNYGLASRPLTKSFTFHDLTKHKIKPWDFTILKPYI